MKRFLNVLVLVTALVPISAIVQASTKEDIAISSYPSKPINFTKVIDLSSFRSFSAQAVYADGTPSTGSITSGSKASATITIGSNPTGLVGLQASLTINIKSTATIVGQTVTLNGIVFTADTDFEATGVSTSTAASNLKARLESHPEFVATVAGATVTVKYALYGTSGNGLTAVTSSTTNFGLSAATFSGGVNQYSIYLNGTEIKEGVNFNANASSATTAHNLVNAINSSTTFNTLIIASSASATPGIVTLTSLETGYSDYSLTSSTSGFLIGVGFPGGNPSDVDIANNIIDKTNHNYATGLKLLLVTITGTIPTGLTTGTTYFAINLNENQYALATTSTTAFAGTKIDITGITSNSTTDVRPLAFSAAAGNGFFWDASNDGTNFTPLSVVTYSSVTYSAAGNAIWDFGTLGYKYLRVNFKGPTNGAIALFLKIFGREE